SMYARFRVFKDTPPIPELSSTSLVDDGEVEDHRLPLYWDYGDLPAAYNTTTYAKNGMRHYIPSAGSTTLYLGTGVDSGATQEQVAGSFDGVEDGGAAHDADEDAVADLVNDMKVDILGPSVASLNVIVHNTTGKSAQLVAWADFNCDNDLLDTGEMSLPDIAAAVGSPETFTTGNIPTGTSGTVQLRFTGFTWSTANCGPVGGPQVNPINVRLRLTTHGNMGTAAAHPDNFYFFSDSSPSPDGAAADGEGEDVQLNPTPTYALISHFDAYQLDGQTVVEWKTSAEIGTIGFYLERKGTQGGPFESVTAGLLAASLQPQGGRYQLVDYDAMPGESYVYQLIELDSDGKQTRYGPFEVTVALDPPDTEHLAGPYRVKGHAVSVEKRQRIAAARVAREQARSTRKGRFGQVVKLSITESGLYYLSSTEIAELLGVSEKETERWIRLNQLNLANRGVAIPYYAHADNLGIYFYAEALDTIYSGENLYWLEFGQGKGEVMALRKLPKGQLPDPTGAESFSRTLKLEENIAAAISHNLYGPEEDFWVGQCFYIPYGDLVPGCTLVLDLELPTPALSVSDDAQLTIRVASIVNHAVNPDHRLKISLNNGLIDEAVWDGKQVLDLEYPVANGQLNPGGNLLKIEGLLNAGVPYDPIYLDWVRLEYPSHYQAENDELVFSGEQHPAIEVTGFGESDLHLLDITDAQHPVLIETEVNSAAENEYSLRLWPQSQGRKYLAVAESAVRVVEESYTDLASDLRKKSHKADYLVIAPEELTVGAQALADYRSTTGFTTMVVNLEDIFDEFNDGLYNPWAMRDFLDYARANWNVPPQYVVLIGEGSADYRDYRGYGDNMLPSVFVTTPYGLAVSDNPLVDLVGNDGIPEMIVGRIPVISEQEISDYIEKLT
ncbi:MAG: hypothetical protein GY794_22110, partial [bacterium]|nr:hypothetical protein [bacterium]